MATQTFVTEMQAINAATVQVQQPNSQPGGGVENQNVKTVQGQVAANTQQTQPTIIQPSQAHQTQQFIVISGDATGEQQETVQLQPGSTSQVVYPAHQYVDGSDSTQLYTNSPGQIQYTEYNTTPIYTAVSGAYNYNAGNTQVITGGNALGGVQSQIVTHQGGTYVLQHQTMDNEGHPLTHTTRASPATVQWLIDNYETAEGVSLPRSTLYSHYLRHCQEQKMDPMNPASFGKLIRSVFLGLRTRRLGTRGNSKYHYYGIRIKATSPLNQFTDDQTMALRQQPTSQTKRLSKSGGGSGMGGDSHDSQGGQSGQESSAHQQHHQYLGDASGAIPEFGRIELDPSSPLPDGLTADHLEAFEELYRDHCEAILDDVINLRFSLIETLWQSFWRNSSNEPQMWSAARFDAMSVESEHEERLPKDRLYALCKLEAVQKFVRRSDYAFYQALVDVLIPDVLRPIPSSLTQAIRNFAKSLENWLKGSMTGVPEEMIKTKIGAVSAFAQTLRRYTSLNHLAQAARAVLQNTSQINQMLTDLNRVDFANVQEQASWVCQCEDAVVHQLEQDFKKTLQQQNSLEQWAEWLENVVKQVLKPHEGSPSFPKAARQFLLKWSFYSSMVIRDLTLRSAASFGSFHLIRLLYDEYMFYLVEHKVAAATGETPIAVMGEVRQFIDLGSVMALGSLDSEPSVLKSNHVSGATVTSTSILSNTISPSSTKPSLTVVGPNVTGTIHVNSAPSSNHITVQGAGGTPQVVTLGNGSHPTVAVVSSTISQPTKTIVVVPVTPGSGDGPQTKRLKSS